MSKTNRPRVEMKTARSGPGRLPKHARRRTTTAGVISAELTQEGFEIAHKSLADMRLGIYPTDDEWPAVMADPLGWLLGGNDER